MFKRLSALFATPIRVKVLAYTFRSPAGGTVQECAQVAGASAPLVMKEFNALAKTGIITYRIVGGRKSYVPNPVHAMAPAVAALLAAFAPTDAEITKIFAPARGIQLLIITGMLAGDDRNRADLLIVARNPSDKAIVRSVKQLERAMSIPLRYALMTREDYDARRQGADRLIRDTFEYPHRVLIERSAA